MTTHIASLRRPWGRGVRIYRVEHEPPDSGPDTYYWCCVTDGHCGPHMRFIEDAIHDACDHTDKYHTPRRSHG